MKRKSQMGGSDSMVFRAIGVCVLGVALLLGEGADAQRPADVADEKRPAKDRICFTLYTVHAKTLKLTAQFYPLLNTEPFVASLQVQKNGAWETVDTADIAYPGYTATFRVEDWEDDREHRYRVAHNKTAFYAGRIKSNPIEKETFVLASMSCNSAVPNHGGQIGKQDIVDNLKKIQPDLIFFAGDQVYDHSQHYRFWLRFGREFGELTRNTPTVCLPDDHDVGQANLWGDGGKRCESRDGMAGGYYMPVAYVQEVERAQTSHLPDPFDPTPILRGIGVYYTHLNWGGMSFAILEDRKFKSGPARFKKHPGARADSITKPGYDPKRLDSPDATLLGERQLRFLEHWVTDWKDAQMKCVLSQTVFAQTCNYSGQHEKPLFADFDCNGWPQTGRNRALSVIRKSFACLVAGDQHLATVVQHGVDEWNDSGFSFASPAIANFWLRWWDPKTPGRNHRPGEPKYTGEYLDGFHNKMTVHAAANPTDEDRAAEGDKLSTRAAGVGVIRFNKPARTITFECWPRHVDMTGPASAQYPGWPITIDQADNFPMRGKPLLPKIMLPGPNVVVTVTDSQTSEVVSSLRVSGTEYQPATPMQGSYDVAIGEGADALMIRGLQSKQANTNTVDATALAVAN